jgi:hypothetical protein
MKYYNLLASYVMTSGLTARGGSLRCALDWELIIAPNGIVSYRIELKTKYGSESRN